MKFLSLFTFAVVLATSSFGKTIPNHAIANLVLGQTDFVSGSALFPGSSFSLDGPRSIAVDPMTQKVFVADGDNRRVLRYSHMSSLVNGAGAEAVFGQPSFGNFGSGTTQQSLSASIRGMFFDRKGRLWVADGDNDRILCFEAAAYRSSNPFADRVFGQTDFVTNSDGTTDSKMNLPEGIVVDSEDRLWVAEFFNNRVLRFDSISTKANGAPADGVLGQADFVSASAGSGAAQMNSPVGIAISSDGTLFVADAGNHRVLRFANAAALANGSPATGVLGQPDFATNTSGLSATKFSVPAGLYLTPANELWVMDSGHNRVLRFDKATNIPSGSAASGVVGQPDFLSNNVDLTNRALNFSYSWPFVDSKSNLWVADTFNNRVLRFPPDVTKPALTVKKPVKKTSKKKVKVSGTASDQYGIALVQYKINNGGNKTASGTTSWSFTAKLKKGKKNKIKVWAVDSVGNKSPIKTVKVRRTKN